MKATEFVKKYNTTKDKEKFVNKAIVKSYMPYEEKISRCTRVIKNTTFKKINDKNVYWENTPAQFMLFIGEIIDYYTTIEVDFTNWLEDFNILEEANLIDIIISFLPQNDYNKLQKVFTMIAQDYHENLRSIPSYFDTKLEAISILLKKFEDSFKDIDINSIQKMFKETP